MVFTTVGVGLLHDTETRFLSVEISASLVQQ